jgi:hypothetical protein
VIVRSYIRLDLAPDSPHIPQALSTLSSLSDSPRTTVSVISPWSSRWNQTYSAERNLELQGCKEVDVIWRMGEDAGEVGCGNVTLIR